jgi:GNAT superfamily N-acetyltransferase
VTVTRNHERQKSLSSKFATIHQSDSILKSYGQIPIRFQVTSELKIEPVQNGLGGFIINEVPVTTPYWVDFDAEKGEGPERWLDRWNIENWTVFSAYDKGIRIGGAVIAFDTPNVNRLEGREDITVLWDLRIHPDYRRKGMGTLLIRQCMEWSKNKKCRLMKIESQSNNVNACRFYAKHAALGNLHRYAYADLPGIAMLDWYVVFDD